MTVCTTLDEAIDRAIIEPIKAGVAIADEFDIATVADQVLGAYEGGYACQMGPDEFWRIVEQHAKN